MKQVSGRRLNRKGEVIELLDKKGQPVELPKRIRYELSPDDIENGERGSCTNCPHARAVKRRIGSTRVRFFGGRVSILFNGFRYYYSAPTYTQEFEGSFDTAGAVQPGIAVIRFIEKKRVKPVDQETLNGIYKARKTRQADNRARGLAAKPFNGRVYTAL